MAESGVKIRLEGEVYDLDDFELGDLEWLEEYLGTTLDDAKVLNSMKAAVGFVYIIKRTKDPSFTIEQARKVKLEALEAPEEEEPAPKRPTGGARSKKSA